MFGTTLGMIAFTALVESWAGRLAVAWTGFYGESFTSASTLLLMVTVILIGSVPTHVTMLLWNETYHKEMVQVVEIETQAILTDEPVFYDPPTAETMAKQGVDDGMGEIMEAVKFPRLSVY
jgi:fructose 1,6-bisphosphatase